MSNPSGKWKVIAYSAMLLPAQCASCGRGGGSNSELFADPGIFYEWDHVQVYFCQFCIGEAASLFGLGVVYELRNSLANKDAELLQIRAALERVERLNDDLISERSARRIGVATGGNSLLDNKTSTVINISEPELTTEPESSDDSQSESQESVNVERSDDISESSSYDTLINDSVNLARTGL